MSEQIFEKIFDLIDAYDDKKSAILNIYDWIILKKDKVIIPPQCINDIKSAMQKIDKLENEIKNFGENQSILS